MNEGTPETIQMDSESVPKDSDNETSLKGSAGEETVKPLESKSSAELSGSESDVETNVLSTNGIESQPMETQSESQEDVLDSEVKINVKTESDENEISEKPGDGSEDLICSDEIKKEIISCDDIKKEVISCSDEIKEEINSCSDEIKKEVISCSDEIKKEVISCNDNSQNAEDSNIMDSEVEDVNDVSEESECFEHSTEEAAPEQIDVSSSQNNEDEETDNGGVQEPSCNSDLNENNESSEISNPTENEEVLDNFNKEIQNVNTDVEDVTSDSDLKISNEEKQDNDNDSNLNDKNSNEPIENVDVAESSPMDVAESSPMDVAESSPMDVDSEACMETNEPKEDNKSDDASQKDNSENESEQSKVSDSDNTLMDVDNDNLDVQNKNDCVQEIICEENNINSSNTSAEQDEESARRSENDGNEVMDTEVVNCNEIEQVDLSENETQKDKEIDRIRIEPNEGDLKSDQKDELGTESLQTNEKFVDPEEGNEALDNVISIDDDTQNQPGNSEQETITGDTNSQSSNSLAKDKDEDICIIPDDMTSKPSVLSKNERRKSGGKENENKSGARRIRVSSLELESSRSEDGSRKGESDDKPKERPRRSAAKLADNKIKSLVQNDLSFEDSNGDGGKDIQEDANESMRICSHCREEKVCKYITAHNNTTHYLCSKQCCNAYVISKTSTGDGEPEELDSGEYLRKCGECRSKVVIDDKCLFWETMDFCNEDCLGKYQTKLGSNCANCKGDVVATSLGKYCVRFGYDVKQFCCSTCLEEYKKGLKVCSYCQKDISTGTEGFLAAVGNKGQFKDFCSQSCMEKYERMSTNAPPPDVIEECAVCSNSKPVRVEVELDNKTHKLCSEPCFAAFKFVNNIREGQCNMCKKYFDRTKTGRFLLFYEETPHTFCCKTCMNVYILANRKVVPCNWCKVKKYNFDMIKKVSGGQLIMMCSLHCLMLYQVSVNSSGSRRVKCDFCMAFSQAQYHLTMSDGTIRNFCSYNCVMAFQNQYPKQTVELMSESEQITTPIPTGGPKRTTSTQPPCVPVISSVQSLASPNRPSSPTGRVQIPRQDVNVVSQSPLPQSVVPMPAPPPPQIYQQIITKPPPAKQMKNKSILCKPYSHTKGVSCRPHPCMKETQTDQSLNRKFLIPIPVPIYVPTPMFMFSAPYPVPVPFPLPVPVPVFIPTTRNSAKGIFKEIKKIQEKIPTDPFEAELLMMAEMVAGDKKQDPTDSESEDGDDGGDGGDGSFSPENVDTSNTFGEDMLQMALKMASELEEPAVDMESVLTPSTITTSAPPAVDPNKAHYASDPDDPDQVNVMSMNRGRKRSNRGSRNSTGGTPSKRGRRTSGYIEVPLLPPPENVPPPRIEVEKPDANMCLKYTFGVNAWRHWVMQKNAELEKAALTNRKIKLFKPELLQLTADELNFSLCLFVKEVRKPNGTEYAPDTIYYLCLGIQQYLFENGRIDNIFTDSYYEKFTDCLDEVAKKFAALYNDSQYIVTRVEEEHLWESKQLGAHSPHVLLSTLMFFNTKHFNLVTVEEHMQLSFSHIMKHWKRNSNTPGVAKVLGSRNVLLRFYPPQSALEANSRKKKVYEQQENEENPLRCPVKLYEFYLSKCPESVKTRNDVFYLLPERSCVPDSPVWYSTMALGKEPLMKMLHRVKMVKEINIALLSS